MEEVYATAAAAAAAAERWIAERELVNIYLYKRERARARIHALRGRRTWWHARPDRVAAAATPLTGRHATRCRRRRRRRVGHVFVRQHQTHKYTHDFKHKTPHDDVNFFPVQDANPRLVIIIITTRLIRRSSVRVRIGYRMIV